MEQKSLLEMLRIVVSELRENSQWGTAHVYQSTYNSFLLYHTLYNKDAGMPMSELTPSFLKEYEGFLRLRSCAWGTVSTYMKVLKATYNRAVDRGHACYIPRLFKQVCTSVHSERKKALEASGMGTLLQAAGQEEARQPELPPAKERLSPSQQRVLRFFLLMFLLRGIPFVDLAYLQKSDLKGNQLRYRRRKTGRRLTVLLTPEAQELVSLLADKHSGSPYLFPFLTSAEGTEQAYREYQLALRSFNRSLAQLAGELGGGFLLSTYTARHTWATMAYHCEVHPGIISEAMGHSSIRVTELYLKPFRDDKIDAANRQVIAYAKGACCQATA